MEILPNAEQQFFYNNGSPLANGTVATYIPGTLTPKTTYIDQAGMTANDNPIALDANGRCIIWASGSYRQIVKDVNGNVIWDQVTYCDGAQILQTSLALSSGAGMLGWVQNVATAVFRFVRNKLYDQVSVEDFGAVANNGTDQTVLLQAAIDSGRKRIMLADGGVYNYTSLIFRASNIEFFGGGFGSVLNCISTVVFSSICLVESCTGIYLHDFEMRGAATTENGGQSAPAPLRAIVNGTNTAGTAHSNLVWNAYNRIERLHITGAAPGTNGFNIGAQFNYANYSTFKDCVVESLYGTDSSFGYGIVCNGKGQQVTGNRFLATITGQGRHAVYMTNTPFDILCQGNYALNFQNEAYTSNTTGSTAGTFGYLKILDNIAENCLQVGVALGSLQQAVIDINAPYSIISGNTIVGSAFSGISCYNVAGCIIAENIIQNVNAEGVWLTLCTDPKVHHNDIFNPDFLGSSTYSGVYIERSTGVEASNNRIDGVNYAAGVTLNASTPVPTGCQLYDNNITGSYGADIVGATLDPSNTVRRIKNEPQNIDYTPGQSTPSVAQNVVRIGSITNSGSVTITNLLGAFKGQIVVLMFYDTNTTVQRGNFFLAGGVDFVSTNRSSLTVSYNGATWDEVCRAVSVS